MSNPLYENVVVPYGQDQVRGDQMVSVYGLYGTINQQGEGPHGLPVGDDRVFRQPRW